MERIHVSVRARPLSPEDAKTSPWRISGNSIFIPNHSSKFEFDRIFGDDCRTREVYQARTRDIVAAAVRGFNGTVFAYGQTNSGKTHTMRGSAAEPGVIPLSVYDLFDTINKEKDREFLLRMSYMEIYNEDINDLLAPEHRKLQIHENLERGIHVAGLQEEIVASPEQVLQLTDVGESHRHIGETNMNVYSSRSHTIFRMIIESRDIQQKRTTDSGDKNEDEDEDGYTSCDAVRVSVLNLVDLAGSERAAKTGAEGVRLKEGSHINKSLMTLGTVIKKLSEGAESQGGHVPYRDSKLTRILQPALGGNSNTAIICNITLAQIHADETKSSLQFASRALRVTNHAQVNEILTDAALLKRQKKEIEELRAKLQGFHSEHLEEEILNLRNKLLQTELERERIALELEEEKKAQAEREKRLQEQAKKIENLSTMVLYSSRDENRDNIKKGKRRDTWCAGALSRETLEEACSIVDAKASAAKTASYKRTMGPLLPFEELVNVTEDGLDNSCKLEEGYGHNAQEDSNLPNPQSLMLVTSRKKASTRNKTVAEENISPVEVPTESDDLLAKFEGQRIASEIQIDYLMRKLAEVDSSSMIRQTDSITSSKESEALLVIKQLQEQIKILEMEKTLSRHNHDTAVELAEGNNISDRKKSEELHEELLMAKEEARLACEKLTSMKNLIETYDEIDTVRKLSTDVEVMAMEVQNLKNFVEGIMSLVDDVFQTFSAMPHNFLDLKAFARQTLQQQHLIISNSEKLQSCLNQKISELENEEVLLQRHSDDLQKRIEDLKKERHNSEKALIALKDQQELEKLELLTQIQNLQKENSCLSSSMLAKERESLRKDLEKTKLKLKEIEFKLKNAVQEKTKLEGEKASAEREIKLLHGQKVLLERDINKRESLAGRRRDSIMTDSKKIRSQADQTMQEEYRQLEVLAFEMESTIASLEEELAAAMHENEVLVSQNETLASNLEAQSEKMDLLNLELRKLQEQVDKLNLELEVSKPYKQQMEASTNKLAEEKEELALQLSESLMEMEEERAIWRSKEIASLKSFEENSKLHNAEITLLSKEMEKMRKDLQSCKEKCNTLTEKLQRSEEDFEMEKRCSLDKIEEIEQLKNDLRLAVGENKQALEKLKSSTERVDELQKDLNELAKENKDLLIRLQEMERGLNQKTDLQEKADDSKDKAKLRMRLRWTQVKLDAVRHRYAEVLNDHELMDRKFKEASAELKGRLQQYVIENLGLKEQLAAAEGLKS